MFYILNNLTIFVYYIEHYETAVGAFTQSSKGA